jgi:hypothetical protein
MCTTMVVVVVIVLEFVIVIVRIVWNDGIASHDVVVTVFCRMEIEKGLLLLLLLLLLFIDFD